MKWAAIAAITAGLATSAIPPRLADYRSWTQLTSGPRLVPYALATACLSSSVQQADARKTHGPHANRWVAVYANRLAVEALKTKDGVFPAGAVIAKEKLSAAESSEPDGVAFMIKHDKGEFAKSGGWEFVDYSAAGPASSYRHCVDCHRTGGTKDYVFNTLNAAN